MDNKMRYTIDGLVEFDLINSRKKTVCTLTYGVQSTQHLKEQVAVIDLLYTPEKYRCKGYGSKILTEFFKHAQKSNIGAVFLVVKSGTFIGTFYERRGFLKLSRFGCYQVMGLFINDQREKSGGHEQTVRKLRSIWDSLSCC